MISEYLNLEARLNILYIFCGLHTMFGHLFVYLARHPVRTELSKAEGRLDSPQQSHHIQVLYPPPGNSTDVTL